MSFLSSSYIYSISTLEFPPKAQTLGGNNLQKLTSLFMQKNLLLHL